MTADDYEERDEACPECGHIPTRQTECWVVGCDDGYIDQHEYDDPLWFDPGDLIECDECAGYGHLIWCPSCGKDLLAKGGGKVKAKAENDG